MMKRGYIVLRIFLTQKLSRRAMAECRRAARAMRLRPNFSLLVSEALLRKLEKAKA